MDRILYKEANGDLTCRARDFDKVFPTLYAYEELEMTPEDIKQTLLNFGSFLCEITGGRMSKTNYTVQAMVDEAYANFERGCDECSDRQELAEIREKLKRYEDAEEEGRLIVLPCPIGTPVYVHRHLCSGQPRGQFNGDCMFIQDCPRHGAPCPEEVREEKFNIAMRDGLGKWFWLTREEAEAALPPERRNRT